MPAPSHRNESLDILRCIAVLLVLGFHYPYYRLWGRLGWIGVDLFFVLSGFLISGLLFREYQKTGTIDLKRFLIRRGLKIYPSYYLLIVMAVVVSLSKHSAALRTQALVSALFVQGYYSGTLYTILAHTWSLAIEEHFYLLLPLLLLFLIAIRCLKPFQALPLVFGLVLLVSLAFRGFLLPQSYLAHMTHMRIDSLFAGVTLGYLYYFRRPWFQRLTRQYALLFAFLLCLPAAFLDQYDARMQSFGLTGLLLGFSWLVAWSVVRTPRTTMGRAFSRVAAKIGFYSYSIYLWHPIVGETLFGSGINSLWKFWSYILACIATGIAMAHLVEMPYLAMREKRFPRFHSNLDAVEAEPAGVLAQETGSPVRLVADRTAGYGGELEDPQVP